MGVFTDESAFSSAIAPARLFKAFFLDADNLIPKVAPQAIQSVEILEGDGGVGTIKKITFGQGSQFSYVKHKVENIDNENMSYSYSLIEGDALTDKIEKITYETQLVESPDGGSIINSISKYHTIGDYQINQDEVKAGKEKAAGLFNLIESYLQANPDAYN
ncbi:major allergen Pru ar 1-like [Humulus lupulus]|uniref:major allergen Pru ar 1-like n=1 Tax=Humulus lupulus TaxID=3486 RepID=UPI002B417F7B|nr:major allergen Pru ar 1-like [Humulus lupulus]